LQEDLSPDRPTSPRALSRLATIHREALRLRETLDDLLRYAGRLELQPQPLDLDNLLSELVDFLAPQAQLSRVQLRQVRPDKPVIADADPKLIKQAALNLMLNAMQAMPNGGELIVGARRTDGQAELSFTDTGPGISADDQAKIFEAYFSKRKGGMGLGLAMTKRIAEEHGGRIELTSELGKGSSFCLILPARKTAPTSGDGQRKVSS
jgi:signal transduction histidine kinase